MTREELIKWAIKYPETMTKFINKLLTQYELSVALEKIADKTQTIKTN